MNGSCSCYGTSYLQPYMLCLFQILPGCCLHLQALKTVGWDKQPFQLIVIDRQSTHPPIRSEKDIFIPILDKLSGSETLSLAHMPEMFCADRALVGVGTNAMLLAHDGTKFYEFQTNEEVDHNRAAFTG